MKTTLIRHLKDIKSEQQRCVVTIGNFDGVHIGHQKLLQAVINKAKVMQTKSLVITFEPHPFEFFAHQVQIPRLTRFREKFSALRNQGVDYVLLLHFNQALASKTASDFVDDFLSKQCRVQHIIVGDDFHFGYKRQGDIKLLEQKGADLGFTVSAMPSVIIEGIRVSSTEVRAALQTGNLNLAAKFLGRSYTMQGRVSHGDKLGQQWGFPTANIFLHRQLTPLKGVFTVLMHGLENEPMPGVANIGIRPTVNGTRTLLEVHLLDFNQTIYGKYVEVEFCKKLREEIHYPNVELLKQQIARDVLDARNYFEDVKKIRGVR